jgi:H+/gluconate symporter-like permease
VIAIAGGSTVLSHVNDSGFWLVGRFFDDLSVADTAALAGAIGAPLLCLTATTAGAPPCPRTFTSSRGRY